MQEAKREIVTTTIEEADKMVEEADTIDSLKALEPMLHSMRIQRSNLFRDEEDKATRDEIMEEMFQIKNIQSRLASKCMSIARAKIKKPRFM